MAVVLESDDLNEADGEILDELHHGRANPSYLSNQLGIDRSYINQRLKRFQEHNHVDKLSRGLYELVEDPREGYEVIDHHELAESLRNCREQLQQARAEAEAVEDDPGVAEIKESLQSAFTALSGQHPDVDMAKGELEAVVEELERP